MNARPSLLKYILITLFLMLTVFPPIMFNTKADTLDGGIFLKSLLVLPLFLFQLFFLFDSFSDLYNIKSPLRDYLLSHNVTFKKYSILVTVPLSFYCAVTLFAIIYNYLFYSTGNAFGPLIELTYLKAFYFSLCTMTVGPAGLEPTSNLALGIVMLQVVIGIIYAILVFSSLSSFLQKTNNSRLK